MGEKRIKLLGKKGRGRQEGKGGKKGRGRQEGKGGKKGRGREEGEGGGGVLLASWRVYTLLALFGSSIWLGRLKIGAQKEMDFL